MVKPDNTVKLLVALYHEVRHKNIPIGTPGRVLAVRLNDMKVLVKFQGFAWPKQVDIGNVEVVD